VTVYRPQCPDRFMTPARLLITGSRTWTDEPTITRELMARFSAQKLLVSGNAVGADEMCEQAWEAMGGQVERHRPDWKRYGRHAGTRRDEDMVKLGADECVAFIQESSRGATYTAELARKAGIPTDTHQPSAENYDRQAGLAFKAGDYQQARNRLRRAAILYPQSPHRELWQSRLVQVAAQEEARAPQGALFPVSGVAR
jgi:hypothetical protein